MKRPRLQTAGILLIGAIALGGQIGLRTEALAGSENFPETARAIMILVDMSGSTNQARRTAYKEAFEKIYRNLAQGDRVTVGTITGRSYIDFKPAVDAEIPKKSVWDNRLQFERNLTRTKEKIRKEVHQLLARSRGAPLTEILNSLNIAEAIFHEEKQRRKILVILSDMIQDSKDYRFDKDRITDTYVDALIAERRRNNLMPDLSGVSIYVAGASATDSDTFRTVQAFWARYLTECRADFSPYRYGHSLISFETK